MLVYLVKLSYDYSKLKTRFENNEERDKEERESSLKNFQSLENVNKTTNDILIKLSSSVQQHTLELERNKDEHKKCDSKLDELFDSRNKTNVTLTELSVTIKMLAQSIDNRFESLDKQFNLLSKKIDNLPRS